MAYVRFEVFTIVKVLDSGLMGYNLTQFDRWFSPFVTSLHLELSFITLNTDFMSLFLCL
jgi:hypothetical protein